ncbi:MAG TPA: hypothetical protein VHM91_18735 [Verrucomicrobiales bacterium]|nr:hypothetical protein [Verrucomicrobiales bacterium]
MAETAGERGSVQPERPRFISLSALPPGNRLPSRNIRPRAAGLKVPKRLQDTTENGALSRTETRIRPVPIALPERPVPREAFPQEPKQLGFNCPSCYTILIIKDPESYDGRAAPCPYCAVNIVAPRIAKPTPFTLVTVPAPAPKELPEERQDHWRPFGKNKEVLDPAVVNV